jgi:hypothetical protein
MSRQCQRGHIKHHAPHRPKIAATIDVHCIITISVGRVSLLSRRGNAHVNTKTHYVLSQPLLPLNLSYLGESPPDHRTSDLCSPFPPTLFFQESRIHANTYHSDKHTHCHRRHQRQRLLYPEIPRSGALVPGGTDPLKVGNIQDL